MNDHVSPFEAFFITLCAYQSQPILGRLVDGRVELTEAGRIAELCWLAIPEHNPDVQIDAHMAMPNHIHGILIFTAQDLSGIDSDPQSPASKPPIPSTRSLIPTIRSFKAAATNRVNHLQNTPGAHLWQPSYHARIITTGRALASFRSYIKNNPSSWPVDPLNPDGLRPAPFCPLPLPTNN